MSVGVCVCEHVCKHCVCSMCMCIDTQLCSVSLQLADQHGVQFFETSAWANKHVSEPFECLASQIVEDVSNL